MRILPWKGTASKHAMIGVFVLLTSQSGPAINARAQPPSTKPAASKKAAAKKPSPGSRGKSIDLLKNLDPARDTYEGASKWEGKAIVGTSVFRDVVGLTLAYKPGKQEYRFTVEAEATSPQVFLYLGLVADSTQFSWSVINADTSISLRKVIQGQPRRDFDIFPQGKKTTFVCEVREKQVSIWADGKEAFHWTDMAALAPDTLHHSCAPDGESLSIAWHGAARISKLEVIALRPGDPPLFAINTAAAGNGAKNPRASGRQAVPDAKALQNAQAQFDDVFGTELRKVKNRDDAAKLTKKLIAESQQIKDDAASRYALLTNARDLACKFGDFEQAEAVVFDWASQFDVDWAAERQQALSAAAKHLASDSQAKQAFAVRLLEALDDAITNGRWDIANELASLAEPRLRSIKDTDPKKRLQQLLADVKRHSRETDDAADAKRKVDSDPGDAAAQLKYGEFLCFTSHDWDTGLPYLAKGSDEGLASIARLELAKPSDVTEQLAIADAWWDHGATATATPQRKQAAVQRSVHWYRQVLPQLKGLMKLKVEKRIQESEKEE